MYEYTRYAQQQSNVIATLRPDIKKVFLSKIFQVLGIVLIVVISLVVMEFTAGLSVFLDIFDTFGIEINPTALLIIFIIVTIITVALILIGNFFTLGNVRYEVYADKILIYKTLFMLFMDSKEIAFDNIRAFSYNNDGLFNQVFFTGSIKIELTGLKEKEITLQFMDNIQQTTAYLQRLVQDYSARKQAMVNQNYEISNTLNKAW